MIHNLIFKLQFYLISIYLLNVKTIISCRYIDRRPHVATAIPSKPNAAWIDLESPDLEAPADAMQFSESRDRAQNIS